MGVELGTSPRSFGPLCDHNVEDKALTEGACGGRLAPSPMAIYMALDSTQMALAEGAKVRGLTSGPMEHECDRTLGEWGPNE